MRLEVFDVLGKWLIGLAAVATVGVSAWKYFEQRKQQIDLNRLEVEALNRQSKQMFLDKQFELYTEAVAVASRLAIGGYYGRRDTDHARFLQLYWGELGMVEDSHVATAMVKFKSALESDGDLRTASLNLARCVSRSFAANWGVELQTGDCPY